MQNWTKLLAFELALMSIGMRFYQLKWKKFNLFLYQKCNKIISILKLNSFLRVLSPLWLKAFFSVHSFLNDKMSRVHFWLHLTFLLIFNKSSILFSTHNENDKIKLWPISLQISFHNKQNIVYYGNNTRPFKFSN